MLFMALKNFISGAMARAMRLSMKGLPSGPHITRYYMYRQLAQFKQFPKPEASVLSISHSEELCKIMGLERCRIVEANYPDYDMLCLPFEDNAFDYVVSDQVLEHIRGDPQAAINETHRLLKPGGLAIHTTCFVNPIHPDPGDFWRFTPAGLRLLCEPFSKIIECQGWGNPDVWLLVRLGLRYDGVPHKKSHPIHKIAMRNHPEWPIVTWIVAEK